MRRIAAALILCFALVTPGIAAQTTMAAQQSVTKMRAAEWQAIIEYGRENYEEALGILSATRSAEGRTALNDYYIGLCQKQAGDYDAAVLSFKDALNWPEPEKNAVVELIALLVNLDRAEEAWQWVDWAEKRQVKPKDIAYFKGLLLMKKNSLGEAIASFQEARTGNPETDQQIDLQIAFAYAQDGKTKEARDNLQAIVTRYPGTDAAAFASEYDQRISTAVPSKRLNFYAGVSYLYDDNVILKTGIAGATSDTRKRKDSGASENLRLEYDAPLAGQWSANLQYNLQNNNYSRLHEYDMLSNSLTASLIDRSENWILSFPLNINHAALDYQNYSFQTTFKPTATLIFTPSQLGQVSFGYSYRDMLQKSLDAASNRSASIYNVQAGYIQLFDEGRGLFNLRGEGFYENTDGSDWRNTGGRLGADLLVPVTKCTRLILTGEGVWQNYQDSSTKRKDTTVNASASLNQQLFHNFYLNLQYYYTRAMSNVDLYDYQRNVFMSGIELRF